MARKHSIVDYNSADLCAMAYLVFLSFTVVGSVCGRHCRDDCRPLLQKHLPLTHIAPDPECCQVYCQVVFLSLEGGGRYTETHTHTQNKL